MRYSISNAIPHNPKSEKHPYENLVNAEHFSLAGIAHKAFDAGFIDREDLLQKNHGRFFKGRVGIHQHMGGLVFLLFRPGGNSCNDQCRRMTVSNVVLQNYHRAFPALFRTDMRLHVCIVDVPPEKQNLRFALRRDVFRHDC